MGYTTLMSLVLTCPPYIFAVSKNIISSLHSSYFRTQAFSTFVFARISDRTRRRAVWLAVQNVMCLIGLLLTAYSNKDPVRYFGLFLVNAGASGCVPGVLAYVHDHYNLHLTLHLDSC